MARYDEAIEWYERGAAAADEASRMPFAMAHAAARFRQGELEDAIRRCDEIVRTAGGDLATLAHAYYLLHVMHTVTGSSGRAAFRGLALPIYEELGDLGGQASVLNNLGIEAYYEGRWDEALELYERSRELRGRVGDVTQVAQQTNNIGEILSDQGRLAEAKELFDQALQVADAAGHELTSQVVRGNLGRAAARAGRFEEAEELLESALAAFREIGSLSFAIETEARLAELEALRGRPVEAILRAQAPLTSARQAGLAPVEALLHRVVGMAHSQLGETDAALEALGTSLEIARGADAAYEAALTLRERCVLLEDAGDATEAAEIFARLGVRRTV